MGIVRSFVASAMGDGIMARLRRPVTDVFDEIVQQRGLPTRQEIDDLRNRADMLDYRAREAARILGEIRSVLGLAVQEAQGTGRG